MATACVGLTVKPASLYGLGTGSSWGSVHPQAHNAACWTGLPAEHPGGSARSPEFWSPWQRGGAQLSGLPSGPLADPCHNGGSCTDGINTAFCDCLPGFQGAFCEEDINECASNPCRNGANCTDCVDGYTCTCPTGFSGIHCENNTPDCTERCEGPRVHAAGYGAMHSAGRPVYPAGIHLGAGTCCQCETPFLLKGPLSILPCGLEAGALWFILRNCCSSFHQPGTS